MTDSRKASGRKGFSALLAVHAADALLGRKGPAPLFESLHLGEGGPSGLISGETLARWERLIP